ncbi:MAG: hypothetical protein PUA93_05960 [Eubacteriales bacterium]|nr:hypothetical protein [Eubacteriales bacterium]
MAKVRKGAKRIGLVLSTSFSVFCLFSSFAAAYSWFSAVRAVHGTAGSFQATEAPLAFDRVDIYQQSDSATASSPSLFNTTDTGSYAIGIQNNRITVTPSGDFTSSFGTYDSMNGIEKKMLYLFHVRDGITEEERKELHIKAYTDTEESKSLFRKPTDTNSTTSVYRLQEKDNPISNVLSYQVYTYTDGNTPLKTSSYYDLDSEDSNRTSVTEAQDKFVNKLDAYGYLSTTDSDSYLDTLSLLPAENDNSKITSVAIVVSFSSDLFNNLFTINIGNPALEASTADSDPKVTFKDDWGFRI